MPYILFKNLRWGGPKPSRMSIQLVDRWIKYPRVIIEDVVTKVDKFSVPIDFVVLHTDEDVEVLVILGQPF